MSWDVGRCYRGHLVSEQKQLTLWLLSYQLDKVANPPAVQVLRKTSCD